MNLTSLQITYCHSTGACHVWGQLEKSFNWSFQWQHRARSVHLWGLSCTRICRIKVAVGATDANSCHSAEPRFEVQPSADIPCAPQNSHICISSRTSACPTRSNALRQLNHIFKGICSCLITINKYFAHLHEVCTRPAGSTTLMTDKNHFLFKESQGANWTPQEK